MGEGTPHDLERGLARALGRAGLPAPDGLTRLTGGATMESWRFTAAGEACVLRRAPSQDFMAERPFGHTVEAEIVRTAHRAGVRAPEVLANLEPADGIGSGYVMRALPGTADPRVILEGNTPLTLLGDAARDLARIHAIAPADLPPGIPEIDYPAAIADLRERYRAAGGARPMIALGLRWLADNCPEPVAPVLNHGDFRLGNLLADSGRLSGVLDWELAHFGDPHEDLAFGCMAVWRFSRVDRPALGLGSVEEYVAAYEQESGRKVDPARLRFWLIYRTVWWALGCLHNAAVWRSGEDRMLERVVISRRTSEQELDLLLLLEDEAPEAERDRTVPPREDRERPEGEASAGEIATAIAEWLETIKPAMQGHDRFQHAVARNALGMIARGERTDGDAENAPLAASLLHGEMSLATPGLLAQLRRTALDKLAADVPKYPMLARARAKWTGEH
ncbi:phosphotransferase family protein [Qipengyuania sp. MTN3-11]|uniref:phosphotransferase family protein n=1 Tax=Qipengyuania sp. MTN3-11 TaxID=3056557 RepID=UPI0036F31EDB